MGIEAIAILFLNCYADPSHETAPRRCSRQSSHRCSSSASNELSQEYREFERCSTVVANAYIGPIIRRYIGEIDARISATTASAARS